MGCIYKLKRQSGYSMVEVAIATALTGLVLLAGSQGLVFLSKSSNNLANKTIIDANNKVVNQNFAATVEAADIAAQYQHMPVPIVCPVPDNYQQPCVRKLDATNNLSAATVAELGVDPTATYIEFFRDQTPIFTPKLAFDLNMPNAKTDAGISYTYSSAVTQGNYFVTWPLVDDTSPPFVVMKSSGQQYFFRMDDGSASSVPPISTNSFVFFFANTSIPATDLNNMVGSLLLVYDGTRPDQYTVRVIKSIKDCTVVKSGTPPNQISACIDNAYWVNPPYVFDGSNPTFVGTNARFLSPTTHEVAIELDFVDTTRVATKYTPDPLKVGTAGANIAWTNQAAAFYLFPTQVSSLNDPTAPMLATPLDIRSLDQFYISSVNTNYGKAQILGVPVALTSFYLKRSTKNGGFVPNSNPPIPNFDLIMTNFNNQVAADTEIVLRADVNAKVVFARRLGTTNFSLFMYDNPNVKKITMLEPDLFGPLFGSWSLEAQQNYAFFPVFQKQGLEEYVYGYQNGN